MNKNIFDPFQNIEAIKAQGYDSRDLRNFAFRGLESANVGDYLDFIEKHQNNLFLQELFDVNCNMSSEEAMNYLQVESSTTEIAGNIMASCNEFYSNQCEELAYIFEKSQSTQNENKTILTFNDFLKTELQYKSNTLSEEKMVDFMSETWTFDDKNLFEATLQQIKGAHIIKNNDLTAKKNFTEALEALFEVYNNLENESSVNGFAWNAEAAKFFDDHKEALSQFYDECDEADLLVDYLQQKHENAIFDLAFGDGNEIKATIARNFVSHIASDLCNTSINDYYNAGVVDKNEIDKILQETKNAQSETINTRKKR